jgi:hypothetical protein
MPAHDGVGVQRCCLSDYVTGNFPKYIATDPADVPALNPPVG